MVPFTSKTTSNGGTTSQQVMSKQQQPSSSASSNNGTTTSNNTLPTSPTATLASSSSQSSPRLLDRRALFYMALLALQFGVQPILTRKYTPTGITRSTVILMQEAVKFAIAFGTLHLSGSFSEAIREWSIHSWITVAVVPAGLYSVQNIAALTAYQNLDALTFNVLNQTKTLSAALCCYFVMGRQQSAVQVMALLLLLSSALVMEGIISIDSSWLGKDDEQQQEQNENSEQQTDDWNVRHITHGVIPIMIASFISGLAGALTQKNLQAAAGRNPLLFSMELCAASCLILLASMTVSPDGTQIMQHGFWNGWTLQTWIPIATNAAGGLVVGLVTKYAGSVRKGFALIFGMLLSGVMQALLQPDVGVTRGQIAGGLLAATSLYLHATNPPTAPAEKKTVKQD